MGGKEEGGRVKLMQGGGRKGKWREGERGRER